MRKFVPRLETSRQPFKTFPSNGGEYASVLFWSSVAVLDGRGMIDFGGTGTPISLSYGVKRFFKLVLRFPARQSLAARGGERLPRL